MLGFVGICLLFSLSACSSSSGQAGDVRPSAASNNETSKGQEVLDQIQAAEISDLPTGMTEIIEAVKAYKQAVESDSKEEAAKLAEEMVGLWKAVEEQLKATDQKLHQELAAALTSLLEHTSSESWDRELLIQLDYKLYQGLRDMKQKIKQS